MPTKNTISIIGGGPSGLIAAEILSAQNWDVTIYERKPSFARKFLMAGRGGLNITHSEDIEGFIKKYGKAASTFKPLLEKFSPKDMRAWCEELGEETFVGSSGRVFPKSFKASPLLRSWLKRLEKQGVQFKLNHDWQGWDDDKLAFNHKDESVHSAPNITLLALGGASWPKLGSDGSWVDILKNKVIEIAPMQPSNCGFEVAWSDHLSKRFEGKSLKSVDLKFQDRKIRGEFIITAKGIEGGAVYALSAPLREEINKNGFAELTLDLKPDFTEAQMIERLQKPKARMSMGNYLRKTLNLSNVAIGLIMERPERETLNALTSQELVKIIKSYSIRLEKPFSLERAISSAGGVKFSAIDDNFMLNNLPNVFVTGEMLDWEAPTGGYLLQGCMASGVHAAHGIINYKS